MANTFTSIYSRRFAGSNNKSLVVLKGTLVVDTPAGSTAGGLPTSLFNNVQQIMQGGDAVISDNSKVYGTVPAYDGKSLLVVGGASNAPMNLPIGTYAVNMVATV